MPAEKTFQQAREFILSHEFRVPSHQRDEFAQAVARMGRKGSKGRRAPTRAKPMTEGRARRIKMLRVKYPRIRIADIAERTGVAFHDISNLLNGTRP